MRRSPYFRIAVGGFAVYVAALVIIRLGTTPSRSSRSTIIELALGIILAGITVGSAVLAHVIFTKLRAVAPAAKLHVANRIALVGTRARKARAQRRKNDIARQIVAWDYWAAKAKGRYDRYWNRACAEFGTGTSALQKNSSSAAAPSSAPTSPAT